ncbi:hypothetical protein CVT26_004345 [Gymnopilus dilepis]|uniref:Uncharacterized protein n=1 Tax=Gymnopilus dilepis TaxID=231916 RepID=A0A409W2F3_9AGAR|nr:hypothetical protein CVT26_004345 [Gymnopilus dilepis]
MLVLPALLVRFWLPLQPLEHDEALNLVELPIKVAAAIIGVPQSDHYTMKFILLFTSVASIASALVIPRQICSEASRFGDLIVTSPDNATSFSAGDPVHIKVNFNCAVNTFGIRPEFVDYTIEVPEQFNNGHEPNIVIARRTLPVGATTDEFTATASPFQFLTGLTSPMHHTYPTEGTDGSQVFIQGGTESPITINPFTP